MNWKFDSGDNVLFTTVYTGLLSRSGSRCVVIRRLTDSEADLCETGPMYAIRFGDGLEAGAFEDELERIKE